MTAMSLYSLLAKAGRFFPVLVASSLFVGCMSSADPELEGRAQDLSEATQIGEKSNDVQARVWRTGDMVEVEVVANQPFRFGAMPVVLVIGDKTFSRSRHAPDGRLDTRIFMIDAAEFDALGDGAEASVGYLDSGAELDEPPPNARGAARMPKIRPDQVDEKKALGTFRKSRVEIVK